jgi:hypothetical protein
MYLNYVYCFMRDFGTEMKVLKHEGRNIVILYQSFVMNILEHLYRCICK